MIVVSGEGVAQGELSAKLAGQLQLTFELL